MYRGSSKGEPTQEQTFAPSAFAAKSTVANPNAPAAAVTSTVWLQIRQNRLWFNLLSLTKPTLILLTTSNLPSGILLTEEHCNARVNTSLKKENTWSYVLFCQECDIKAKKYLQVEASPWRELLCLFLFSNFNLSSEQDLLINLSISLVTS